MTVTVISIIVEAPTHTHTEVKKTGGTRNKFDSFITINSNIIIAEHNVWSYQQNNGLFIQKREKKKKIRKIRLT